MNIIFYLICYLSFLMLLGVFIRSKIKIFQELFIPASVIGGIIGLILGPEILGYYFNIEFFPKLWLKELALLPGILIIPILASIPLGLNFKNKNNKSGLRDVSIMGAIMFIVTFSQIALGYIINFIFKNIFNYNIYPTFGIELNTGFAGGHGTAGMIGRILKDMNMEYWELAQGIATTIATFGLIGGITLGIFLINRASRNGETTLLSKPSLIPMELKRGYHTDIEKQSSLGRETMLSSSVDTLAFHISIIFVVCGASYIILNFIKLHKIPVLSSFSVWAFAMVLMFLVWKIIKFLKLEWCIDVKVKSKISSSLTEFAVVAAITTMPLKAIFSYIFPIGVMILFGFIFTWAIIRFLSYKYFKNNYAFERAVAMLGTSLGVFLTGLLLLRICDPDFSSPVLGDYSLGFSLTALMGPVLMITCIGLSIQYGALIPVFLNLFLIVITVIFIKIISYKFSII